MDKLYKESVEDVNAFLEHISKAKALWDKINENAFSLNAAAVEQCPVQFQQFFSMFCRSEWRVMMPRLTDYANSYGGFEIFISDLEAFEKEEAAEQEKVTARLKKQAEIEAKNAAKKAEAEAKVTAKKTTKKEK